MAAASDAPCTSTPSVRPCLEQEHLKVRRKGSAFSFISSYTAEILPSFSLSMPPTPPIICYTLLVSLILLFGGHLLGKDIEAYMSTRVTVGTAV